MQTIFPKFRRRIANALFTLSERAGGVSKKTSVTPKSAFAISSAVLGSYIGFSSRKNGIFYRCEYDLNQIKEAAETEGYLAAAIQKYSELFMKSGYTLKGEQDGPADYLRKRFRLMSYMSDNCPFPLLMRETAYDLVKFSNAFWIKSRSDSIPFIKAKGIVKSGKCVSRYSRLDPAQVRIQFDEDGEIRTYKQVSPAGKEKEFKPEDVIHFTLNRPAESVWGAPRWLPALEDIRFLRVLEGNVASLSYRFSTPMVQAQVGLPQEGLFGTKKEIDDTTRLIENTPPDGMLVTNERVKLNIVGAEGNALDLHDYLLYFENRVFTDLNTSQAMMGRGGSKQDADSMEEQVHNAVKDNQSAFAIQFKEAVITELLLEGGYNPILKDEDDVNLVFNEINLDTRVKLENHILNIYHSNAITRDEMRVALGYRSGDLDESQLYANSIEQKNTLEQIDINHQNAIELAKLQADLAQQTAKAAAGENKSSGSSGSNSSNYTKKNTGNGKSTKTGRASGAVKSADSPSNQHGTYSAKIKESAVIDELSNKLRSDGRNLSDIKNKVLTYVTDMSSSGAKEGAKDALDELIPDVEHEIPSLAPQNDTLIRYFNKNIEEYFGDINKNISNTGDECGFKHMFESQKYRLNMLADFVYRKSYWYSYLKTCESHGVNQLKVYCRDESRHKDSHAGKIINARDFNINDIPGYSTNCRCYLKPLKEE